MAAASLLVPSHAMLAMTFLFLMLLLLLAPAPLHAALVAGDEPPHATGVKPDVASAGGEEGGGHGQLLAPVHVKLARSLRILAEQVTTARRKANDAYDGWHNPPVSPGRH
ncbi:hypothetical protein ACP70R_029823 [Stipagrostis hirtigluma subsp. patula]